MTLFLLHRDRVFHNHSTKRGQSVDKNIFKDIRGQGLLLIVVIGIICTLLIFVVETNKETSSEKIDYNITEAIDNADEDFDEFREDVKDEIEDHTDSK